MLPLLARVAPEPTRVLPATEPVNRRVPWLIVVDPVNLFCPESSRMPVPSFTRLPPVPPPSPPSAITPEIRPSALLITSCFEPSLISPEPLMFLTIAKLGLICEISKFASLLIIEELAIEPLPAKARVPSEIAVDPV